MTSTRVRHKPSIRSSETAAFFAQAVDGTRLYVEERCTGDGALPASASSPNLADLAADAAPSGIVLCDGILCDGYVYKWFWDEPPVRAPLAHWHYRGHGRSEAPKNPQAITVPDHARDLRAVCSALGYQKRVLVGHSFGVSCVLESLRQDPTGVLGVVLVSGTARPLGDVFRGQSNLFGFLEKLDVLTRQSPRLARGLWSRIPAGVVARLALSMKEVNSSVLNPDDIRPYFEHLSRLDPQFTLRMLQTVGHYDLTPYLSELSVPALVIAGSADTFIPAAETEALAAALPDARYVCFEGGTHVCPLEFRDAFAHHVRAFLEQIGFFTSAAAQC